ncbi:RloB family protein [Psychromonas sp. PT13]|uniref:RloB family protein n=1 Tax=Psychromonas sp. PT13 TaxID=3439547 RepID=UPI003EC07431
MGTDNLHHKRKAKAAESLQRRQSRRSSYDKILIVCEGSKTEPNYFKEIVNYYKLNTANVEIDGTCGSSPKSVLARAEELADKESQKGDAFDQIYCVFDRDSHESYDITLRNIAAKVPKKIYIAAVSVPCFEYWLLLHFQYTTKPYHATGNSSIGNEVLKELKKFIPNYTKGNRNIFSLLIDQVEFAKQNSIRALNHSEKNHTDNPSTKIHELVDYLQTMKDG